MAQEIFADAAPGNMWTSRTPRRISSTGVDVSTPIYTQIHSGNSITSTPDSSENSGSSITIGISGTSTAPPAGDLWIPGIGNKSQSASPNISKSNKLDPYIDRNFTSDTVLPPICTGLFNEKISNSSIQGSLCAHTDATSDRSCQSRDTTIH